VLYRPRNRSRRDDITISVESIYSNYTVINFRPKLREFLRFPLNRNFGWDFVCFFVKPKVSVTQNHAQNSDPKFRLLFPDWILEKFDFDFWSPDRTLILFSFSGLFGAWTQDFLGSKSTTETNGPSGQLNLCDMSLIGQCVKRSFVLNLKKILECFVDFTGNFSWIIGMLSERNAWVAKTRNFELLCIYN
jgi:hypothetical protein